MVLAIKKPPSSYHFFHYNLKAISFKAASFLQGCSFFIVNAFWCKKRRLSIHCKEPLNHNHQLNWWFALALKGPYASSVSRRTEKVCQPHDFLRLRLKALFYYLLFLATRERVDIFFHTYLVICDVLLQLISDVLFYRFFVSSNCIYIISSTPEMSISIFIF